MASGSSQTFRTEIMLDKSPATLKLGDKVMLMGSCFTENMGSRLHDLKFPVNTNPFGISYNPLSLAWALTRLRDPSPLTQQDLSCDAGRWFSFQHHSSFSRRSPDLALAAMNEAMAASRDFLSSANFLFLTFGSAWAFEHAERGEVVANCHKLPHKLFTRRLVPAAEAEARLEEALAGWLDLNPDLTVVVTVSPVRHWKDGPVENSVSKANLIVAAHNLVHTLSPRALYFPSYEIMMDDLRDYRFYKADLLHPSDTAVEYIWDRFEESFVAVSDSKVLRRVKNINRAASHRAVDASSDAHQRFLEQQLRSIRELQQKHPHMSFEKECAIFMQDMTPHTLRQLDLDPLSSSS